MNRIVFLLFFLVLCQPAYGNVYLESLSAARQVNVVSVHDSSYDKLTNESKGLLSSYKQVDEKRASRAIGSHLQGKNIQINAGALTMIGSSIEADSARITAQVLNLASDKNRTFERHSTDTSGLILRTIKDKGHVKDTAVASTIKAEQLIFNGKDITEQLSAKDDLIAALSSEHNLNIEQINQIKAVLNSKEWDKETTTLSQAGALIVQAVVTYFTAGAGTAIASGITNAAVQAAVSAAVNSIASQVTSQLLTAALTGNGLHLDLGAIARNAVLSGLVAGVNLKMDSMIADANLGKVGSAVARGVGHAVSAEAAYGGKFGDVLKRSLVSEASAASFAFIGHELEASGNQKLNLPEKTVLHAMVGGTLARISGGDFTTGAIATATSHVVAGQVKSHYLNQVISGEMSLSEMEGKVTAISRLVGGAAAIAVNPDISPQELSAAQAESASVAQNNSLKLIVTAAKIGKRLYEVERKLKRAGKKLGKADIKKVLKEEGLDIVGDLYTFIDPEAGVADMAWAAADLLLGTGFNNRAFAVAKKFGKGKKPKTVDSILTGTHKYDKPNLNDRINQRGDAGFEEGATTFTNSANSKRRIDQGVDTIGSPNGTWVTTTYQADKLQHQAKSIDDIERRLGLPAGHLGERARRFDIKDPQKYNIRKPNPEDATGNPAHRPNTGLTTGGLSERIIDTPSLRDAGVSGPVDLPLSRAKGK